MKYPLSLLATFSTAATFAVPMAENVTFSQDANNVVTITYTLNEAPAIVTLDIQTNVTGNVWSSIGAANIAPGVTSDSEAYRKVTGSGTHTIKWRPYRSWPGDNLPAGMVRAVVTAWSLDNPPDYMVVDISNAAKPNTWRYYPDADSVPGGVLGNEAYRKTSILMRKILAKDVTWTMGSIGEDGRNANETSRVVALTNDYYMAVFETTQEQWRQVMGDWPAATGSGSYTFINTREMRPAQNISYNEIRTSGVAGTYNVGNEYPNAPHSNSFLGKLKTRTGVDFDLPSEAQWEFACRAGNGEGYWGDGSIYMNATIPGRHKDNGGLVEGDYANVGPEKGSAICGSYAPNSWGIYDMHGNVAELCIDWYQVTVPVGIGSRPNINLANPAQCLDGTTFASSYMPKTKRGGSFGHGAYQARSAARNADSVNTRYYNFGCRVICPFERP